MFIYHQKEAAKEALNLLGSKKIPFVFLIDFEMERIVISTDVKTSKEVLFNINGVTNIDSTGIKKDIVLFAIFFNC